MNHSSSEICSLESADNSFVAWLRERRGWRVKQKRTAAAQRLRAKLGREPILLSFVEYRILELLASRPYHAFTASRIVASVSTARQPVTEETLGLYITSLRRKLGLFADYIQSVPYIGYRFRE